MKEAWAELGGAMRGTGGEQQTRALAGIERIRQAVRRMRGKYRLGIAPAHMAPVDARKAIAVLWLALGVTGAAPDLHGDPLLKDLKAFRAKAFIALELLDDIEAAAIACDDDVAGQLLPELFNCVNGLWRCCAGLKLANEERAAKARTGEAA